MYVRSCIPLDHLDRLTDSTGLIQHAIYSIPRRESGYTTEWLRPSSALPGAYQPADDPPVYELYGEFLARRGQLDHAIRYREHVLPVAAALADAARR